MAFVLIPGFMLDADLWRDVRPALGQMGRVIDADTTQDDTVEAMAIRALAALGEPAIVIGFSMGGYVAREMAYRAATKVRGLVLVASSTRGDVPPPQEMSGFRQLSRAAVARSLHPDHRTAELIARVQAMSRRLGPDVYARQSRMRRRDDTDQLGRIQCRSLVVAAKDDELRTPADAQVLHQGIPGSALTTVEHSGHLVPIEQPAQLIAAIQASLDFSQGRQLGSQTPAHQHVPGRGRP